MRTIMEWLGRHVRPWKTIEELRRLRSSDADRIRAQSQRLCDYEEALSKACHACRDVQSLICTVDSDNTVWFFMPVRQPISLAWDPYDFAPIDAREQKIEIGTIGLRMRIALHPAAPLEGLDAVVACTILKEVPRMVSLLKQKYRSESAEHV